MKQHHLLYGMLIALASLSFSCTDEIKFGNAFLEKAPGGDATADTIFNSPEYTKRFLAGCYSRQYYGLTFGTGDNYPNCVSGWVGKFDALTDCYQLYYTGTTIYKNYYMGVFDANTTGVFGFDNEFVWQTVRACLTLLERIDEVPGLTDAEKACMKAEAYCIIASRYFDLFQFYGGLPIIESRFQGTEGSYDLPRATAEETVAHMVGLLDKAINTSDLPWAYTGDLADTETGRWTKAGAMGMKCRILQFAASPLFNSDQGYYGGASEAEQQHLVWYGEYKQQYWTDLKKACEEFITAWNANGHYKLLKPSDLNSAWTNPTPEQYRLAYRRAYFWQGSPEILHSVRAADKHNTRYNWFSWVGNGRNSYCPTQEYVEMFPWADGTPFDWEQTEQEGKLNEMFLTADIKSDHSLTNIHLTRDPRLYETAFVSGVPTNLNWSSANMSGNPYETWVGGATAGNNPAKESDKFATGYYGVKFILYPGGSGGDNSNMYLQWPTLRLSDVLLMYAEALLQASNDCTNALVYINQVRDRVGLGKLEEVDKRHDYTSDKDALLEELLNERAREFGMENIRFFDMIRYKRTDLFEKDLHRIVVRRLKNGEVYNEKWYGNDNKQADFPLEFQYSKESISNPSRYWWNNGFDPKWLLAPIPNSEINKNYGLIQNPGW